MKAAICDICGDHLKRWFRIEITVCAPSCDEDVKSMLEDAGTKEICLNCMRKIEKMKTCEQPIRIKSNMVRE